MGWRDLFAWSKPKPRLEPMVRFEDASAGDRLVLAELVRAGADLQLPRDIVHYLYLPNRADATIAAENLQLCGYVTEIGMDNNPADPAPFPFVVRARILALANHVTIGEARRIFEELAAKLEGDYDGWEAATRP
jgi:hypothetical protein